MKSNRLLVFKHFIEELATLSKCTDKHVAAIITNEDLSQIFSIGVNGGPKGGTECLCNLGGKYTCAHAEANALVKCTVDCHGKTLLCTLSPCVNCATLIINAGISTVYYIKEYKDATGIGLMQYAGINVECIANIK